MKPNSFFSTAGLARFSARRPWTVIAAWIVILILGLFAATGLNDALTTENAQKNNPDSVLADDLIAEHFRGGADRPATETIVVYTESMTVDDPAVRAVVEQTTADLRGMTDLISGVTNYYELNDANDPAAASLVAADRHSSLISVVMTMPRGDADDYAEDYLHTATAHEGNGVELLPVGNVSLDHEFATTAEEDLRKGEAIGFAVALVVLVIVFGALVAAGLPLILGLVSIGIAVGLTALIGRITDLSFFVTNMISMIGLAVGIDYALFIVERYREERARGLAKIDAIEAAGGTASKAVLFSGMTVVFALLGLFLLPATVTQSLGMGAVVVVIVAVSAMLTLVPAILGLLGDRINWPSRRGGGRKADGGTGTSAQSSAGFWGRVAHAVMARPLIAAVLATSLLIALTIPYFDLEKGNSGVETLPDGDAKSGFQILARDYFAGMISPVDIVIEGAIDDPATTAGIDSLQAAIAADGAFGPASLTFSPDGEIAIVSSPLTTDANAPESYDAIERLRANVILSALGTAPVDVYVGGETATNLDFNNTLDEYTPIVFAFVLGLSFLLLMLAFRSIVVPITAIVMNLLSVGAAYGMVVLVFQKGYGAGLFGFQETPTIEAWLPIFLFCILFGLSMDYHVFLLSRIREHFDQTGRNRESVAAGLQSTAKIITGAAVIMVAVFGGFATGRLASMQQIGFGLAVAVLLDATVVRSILVPATMALLGDKNWYLPKFLRWLPNLSIEGAAHPAPVSPTPSHSGDD